MSDLSFTLFLWSGILSFSGLFVATVVINPYGASNNAWTRGLGWVLTASGLLFMALFVASFVGGL